MSLPFFLSVALPCLPLSPPRLCFSSSLPAVCLELPCLCHSPASLPRSSSLPAVVPVPSSSVLQTQLFNGSKTLVTSHGFSVVTFDGAVGSAVTPRTSSLSSHFDEDDRRAVESLRAWAAAQLALPAQAGVTLAAVQPKVFFDLTCQLLAKAPMDSSCTLLKVGGKGGLLCGVIC